MEGVAELPYAIPNIRVEYIEADPGIPYGFWRSVGMSFQSLAVEAFIAARRDGRKGREQIARNLYDPTCAATGVSDRLGRIVSACRRPGVDDAFRGHPTTCIADVHRFGPQSKHIGVRYSGEIDRVWTESNDAAAASSMDFALCLPPHPDPKSGTITRT